MSMLPHAPCGFLTTTHLVTIWHALLRGDPGVRGLPSRVSLVWRRGCGVSFVDVDANATSRVGALDVDYDDVSLHKIICQPSGD